MKEAIVNPEAVKALADDVDALKNNGSLDISSKTAYTGDVHSVSAGYYRCTSAASNIPVAENGYLSVIYRADNTKLLQYITDSNKVYTQTLSNGTWRNWEELASNSNKKVVQLYYNGSLNLEQGTEITLNDSVRNYDILILEMYASVSGGGGTRKFSTVALKPYITNDDGGAANYIEASVFYSSSYNAGIGFTTNGNKITVAEVNKTGYPYIKGITVYGIKLA